jgi:hypothetical protein
MKAAICSLVWIALLAWESLAQGTTRIAGDLFEYQFLRSDCSRTSYADNDSASLIGSLKTYSSSCLPSNGIAQYAFASKNVSKILPALASSNSFLFEFWIDFEDATSVTQVQPILSLCDIQRVNCDLQVLIYEDILSRC